MTPVHICPSTRPRRLAAAVCLAAALTVSACADDPDPAATATDAATAAEATTAAEGAVHSPEAATAQATTPAAPDAPEARTVCPDEAGDVVVIAGDIDCGEAVDVMAEYERRRGAEGGGNALVLSFGDWSCNSPTAAAAADGASAICTDAQRGVEIHRRS